jgi:hypothetical protein
VELHPTSTAKNGRGHDQTVHTFSLEYCPEEHSVSGQPPQLAF